MSKKKVTNLTNSGYTPTVMAHDLPWEDLEQAMVCCMNKDGDASVYISAMSWEQVCYLKCILDSYLLKSLGDAGV
jgi:hypothetical protein